MFPLNNLYQSVQCYFTMLLHHIAPWYFIMVLHHVTTKHDHTGSKTRSFTSILNHMEQTRTLPASEANFVCLWVRNHLEQNHATKLPCSIRFHFLEHSRIFLKVPPLRGTLWWNMKRCLSESPGASLASHLESSISYS